MAEYPCRPYDSDSDPDDELDEDEVERNFDEEASLIVQSGTLSKKSIERYLCVYNKYKTWRNKYKNSLSNSEKNSLIVYFNELKLKLKSPTLWSIWSMLKKTLNTREDIDINRFCKFKDLIKANARG